jgi:hypothetical protein
LTEEYEQEVGATAGATNVPFEFYCLFGNVYSKGTFATYTSDGFGEGALRCIAPALSSYGTGSSSAPSSYPHAVLLRVFRARPMEKRSTDPSSFPAAGDEMVPLYGHRHHCLNAASAADCTPSSHQLLYYYADPSSAASYFANTCGHPTDPMGAMQCDGCRVCGGLNRSVDCAGVCYGGAAVDVCGQCADGTTGITPGHSCGKEVTSPYSDEDNGNHNGGWSRDYDDDDRPHHKDGLGSGSGGLVLVAVLACSMLLLSACLLVVRSSVVNRMRNLEMAQRQRQRQAQQGVSAEILAAETELIAFNTLVGEGDCADDIIPGTIRYTLCTVLYTRYTLCTVLYTRYTLCTLQYTR